MRFMRCEECNRPVRFMRVERVGPCSWQHVDRFGDRVLCDHDAVPLVRTRRLRVVS